MQLKSIIAVLATGLSFVAAEVNSTSTSTQTLTKTVTITQCNPTHTNCPGRHSTTTTSTTTSWLFPLSNSTRTAGPTASAPSSVVFSSQTSLAGVTQTPVVSPPPATQTPSTSKPPTGGAGGLFVQPAVLLVVLGAGVALLA